MKCVGNCAICTLDVDKTACCQVQILRNVIEVKKLLKEKDVRADLVNVYKGIASIESEGTDEIGLNAPGTDVVSKE